MADDNQTAGILSEGLSGLTEQLKQNNRSQAGRDSMRTKNERDLLKSQDATTGTIETKLNELKDGQEQIQSAQVEGTKETAKTGDAVMDASNDDQQSNREESKEKIKESVENKKLFTGLGKVFTDTFSSFTGPVMSAIKSPFSSMGVDPKAIGKSLLSIGVILGLVAFFKSPMFQKLKTFTKDAFEAMKPVVEAIKNFASTFSENIGPLVDSFVGVFKEAFNGVKDIVQGLFSGDASQFMTGIKSILFDVPIKIVSYIGDAFFSLVESVLAAFGIESEMVTNIKLAFRTLPEAIEKAIQGVMDFFTITIPEFFTETLPEKYEAFKESVKTGVSNLLSAIVDPIIALKDNIVESIDMGIDKIKNGILGVVNTVKGAFNGFIDGLKGMANKVIDLINKVPGVEIDKFKLSKQEIIQDTDTGDAGLAERIATENRQKMKLAEEQSLAETLDENMPKRIIPEYSTAKGGLGFTSADLARAKHNYFGADTQMFQDDYADTVDLDDILGNYRDDINKASEQLQQIKNLEKENAELKNNQTSGGTNVIQQDNSISSVTTEGGSRVKYISYPSMDSLQSQAQN